MKILLRKMGLNREIHLGGVSHTDVMLFTKHLAITLQSGLTLIEGLQLLQDQAVGAMKSMLHRITEVVCSGQSLSSALALYPKVFSSIYLSLVKTGEISGSLERNLVHLADQLRKSHEMRKKVRSAMMYPLLVLIAVFGLGLSVSFFVLPKIIPLFQSLDVDLPFSTRVLIGVAEAFDQHGVWIVVGSTCGFFGWVTLLRSKRFHPLTHQLLLKLPVFGRLFKHIELERFTRTLGVLLESGMPMDASLKATAESMSNVIYRRAVATFLPHVQQGNPLADSVAIYPKLFPPIVSRMMHMGENTGNLDQTLNYLNEFYEGEVDSTMKNLSTILEPFLLIFIGVIVGFVAISILGPIYKITGNLR